MSEPKQGLSKPLDILKEIDVSQLGDRLKRPMRPDRLSVLIGKAVVFLLADPKYRQLLSEEALESQYAYLQHAINLKSFKRKCCNPNYRQRIFAIEEKLFPGLITHFILRKRKIEELARQAIEDGIEQFVSFEAGFDTLLSRLADEFPSVTCIEVDLAANQSVKKKALKRKPANLHFVDLNLQEPYVERVMLACPAFIPKKRTFFIAEGVLYFLDDDDVDRLFTFFQDQGGQRSRFAFTFLERGIDHKATYPEVSPWTDMILKLYRFKFGWGLRIEHINRFLNDRYFALLEVLSAQDLRRLAPEPLPPTAKPVRSDNLALAELVFND